MPYTDIGLNYLDTTCDKPLFPYSYVHSTYCNNYLDIE
jgi:hypothetical protein